MQVTKFFLSVFVFGEHPCRELSFCCTRFLSPSYPPFLILVCLVVESQNQTSPLKVFFSGWALLRIDPSKMIGWSIGLMVSFLPGVLRSPCFIVERFNLRTCGLITSQEFEGYSYLFTAMQPELLSLVVGSKPWVCRLNNMSTSSFLSLNKI